MDAFWNAPPVIRTVVAATVITSFLVYGRLLNYAYILFYPTMLYKTFPPQIWRLATSFWLTGPQMGMLFDPYFLWTYGSALEIESPRFTRKGDFFFYVFFVELVILILDAGFLGGVTFLPGLILAFAYTYSQDNANRQASFFIISFSARYLPYAMLAMTFIMASPEACKHQATGLFAAHLYDFLTRIWPRYGGGKNWIDTPEFVRKWFEVDGPRTGNTRGYGTAFEGRPQAQAPAQPPGRAGGATAPGQSGGWSSAVPNWNARGAGRRLGE